MSTQLQFVLIICSITFFIILIRNIKKAKMSIDNAVIWVFWGLSVIIISIFPEIIYKIASALGFMAPISAIFLFMIFLLYVLVFYLFMKISVLEDKVKNLTHSIALMEKERKDGK